MALWRIGLLLVGSLVSFHGFGNMYAARASGAVLETGQYLPQLRTSLLDENVLEATLLSDVHLFVEIIAHDTAAIDVRGLEYSALLGAVYDEVGLIVVCALDGPGKGAAQDFESRTAWEHLHVTYASEQLRRVVSRKWEKIS